jgi:oligoribonuclease (3'-5' exoribonuclease)
MKYLSFDLEATGLRESDLIIEFAAIAFDAESSTIEEKLSFHCFVKCPSFEDLKGSLDPWVIENNETLIRKAHSEGLEISDFKEELRNYIESPEMKKYFNNQKITLFGKSMAAIDLPFLNRDLGWDFMRKHFEHRQLDLSSVAYNMIDLNYMPQKCTSGSELMRELGFGEVAHTALADAINTAKMYLEIKKRFQSL